MYSKYVLTGGKSKDDDKGLVYVHGDLVYSCPGGAAKYRVHVPHHKDCPGIEDPFAVCKCDYRADMAVPEYDEGGSQVRLVSHSVAGVFSEWLIKKDHTEGWQYSVAIPVHRDAAADALDRGRAPMYQHQPPFCKVCHFLDASIATGTATFNMHRLSGTIWGYDAVVIVSREEIDSREVHSISQAVFTRLIDCISSEMGILCGVPACYVNDYRSLLRGDYSGFGVGEILLEGDDRQPDVSQVRKLSRAQVRVADPAATGLRMGLWGGSLGQNEEGTV